MAPLKFDSPYVISTITIPVRKNNIITIFGVGTTAPGYKQRILVYVVDLTGKVLGNMTRFYSKDGTGSLPLVQADDSQAYTHLGCDEETKVYVEFQRQPDDGGAEWESGDVDTTKFIKYPTTPGDDDVRVDIIPSKLDGTDDKHHSVMTVVQIPTNKWPIPPVQC